MAVVDNHYNHSERRGMGMLGSSGRNVKRISFGGDGYTSTLDDTGEKWRIALFFGFRGKLGVG